MQEPIGPKSPRVKTMKRLFALSGNQCAMPGCEAKIVDPDTNAVVGVICHIKGSKPKAPRYDPSQDNEARHGFDNLVLLCGTHHKIIDDNEGEYTVESLLSIKREHEFSTDVFSADEKTANIFCNFQTENNDCGGVEHVGTPTNRSHLAQFNFVVVPKSTKSTPNCLVKLDV